MKIRVAVTSSDGRVVDQHFGHCGDFRILEIDSASGAWNLVERRSAEPTCDHFSHQQDHVRQVAELLTDCGYLLTYRIGPYPYRLLNRLGVVCLETPEEKPVSIDGAMERLAAYLRRHGPARDTAAEHERGESF